MIDRFEHYIMSENRREFNKNIDYKRKFKEIILNLIEFKKQLATLIIKLDEISNKNILEFTNDEELKNLIKIYNEIELNKEEIYEIINLVKNEQKNNNKNFFQELKEYMYTYKIDIIKNNIKKLDGITDEFVLGLSTCGNDNLIKETKKKILFHLEKIDNILKQKEYTITKSIINLKNNENYTINSYRKFLLNLIKFIHYNKIELDNSFLYQITEIHKITDYNEPNLKDSLETFVREINLEDNISKQRLKKLQNFIEKLSEILDIKSQIQNEQGTNYQPNY